MMMSRKLATPFLFLAIALIALFVIYSAAANEETEELTEEWKLKSKTETYNRVVTVGDKSFVYYAQNSPEYAKIWVGDGFVATVGGNTCASFSLANALVNTAGYEDLPLVRNIATSPIKIDTRNILKGMGMNENLSYEIARNEDYFRYLPLAIINIAGGNNESYGKSTNFASSSYFKKFIKTLGLELKQTKDINACVEEIKNNNAVVIVCTGSAESPIANKYGHYMLMVDVQDNKVFFLDSFLREKYDMDKKGIIHLQEPGVFWVDAADVKKLCLYGTKYIVYPSPSKIQYTQEDYERIIGLSNTMVEEKPE